jgi:hypothetical protein
MILGIGLAPATGHRPVWAQETPTVAGTWTLNADKSDNARERLSAAMRNRGVSGGAAAGGAAAAGGRSGGSRSGGRRGGGGGGGGGVDTTAAVRPQGGGGRGSTVAIALLQGSPQLTIRFEESKVVLDRGGMPLELTTDGKAVKFGYPGAEVEYKAKWNGKKLEVETKYQAGPRVVETYELDKKDPGVMTVDVRFTEPGPNGNVNVHMKRIYDRG